MLNKIKELIRRDRKIIIAAVCAGFLFTAGYALYSGANYSDNMQKGIADSVIRLHVRANSDSTADQELKLKVRDGILENMQTYLDGSESKDEVRVVLLNHMSDIEGVAQDIIAKNGENYAVVAYMTYDMFPTKKYGNVAFPAGKYEALRVEIGDAQGQNWWCVMYPPLCFVDVTQGEISDAGQNELKNVLPAEQYDLVTKSDTDTTVKVKFKIVELWQNIKW